MCYYQISMFDNVRVLRLEMVIEISDPVVFAWQGPGLYNLQRGKPLIAKAFKVDRCEPRTRKYRFHLYLDLS
jgi:hypothetical protein